MKKKARIGVIGAGWWAAENHIPVLASRDDVELAAVCRLGNKELQQVAGKFGFSFATEDYRELLAHGPYDGIIVCSPHWLHYEHAVAALEANCHVLVEKPFTTNIVDAEQIADLSHDKGLHVMVPCGWNFSDLAEAAKKEMSKSGIGEPAHVVLQMGSALGDLFSGHGFDKAETAMFQPEATTWADPEKAGGYGWGQLCHALTLLYLLVDLDPKEIMATAGRSVTGADFYDSAIVRFSNNATGVLSGASSVPKQRDVHVDIRIFGTDGMALLDLERARFDIVREDKNDFVLDPPTDAGVYECERPVHRFVDLCLGKDVDNPSDANIATRVVRTLDLMYSSFESGNWESQA